MLIVRSPMRISLGGGGTDLEAYYSRYGGVVVSTSIDKYFYVLINPADSRMFQVISADYQSLFRSPLTQGFDGKSPLALPEAIFQHFRVEGGLQAFLASEVPPGTGLGSSSAAAVAIIHALSTWLKQPLEKDQLAELAASIEISRLGLPIGKQDHYASAFGGLNMLTFSNDGVEVAPLQIDPEIKLTLEKRLMLFSTGLSHASASILVKQRKFTQNQNPNILGSLHNIKQAALDMKRCLERGDLDEFARLLDYSWQEKRLLAPGLTNHFIDRAFVVAGFNGAKAGKITGAGGGGFLLLYCPERAQAAVTAVLEERGLKRLLFQFEQAGASVVFQSADEDEHSSPGPGDVSRLRAFSSYP